ncbi:actin-like protein [Phytophthora infestans T30-4]|uniref:Actin-like protein n=1 Tax=Phytophthora infestans (strain T30-4) TaxID=403677 RepID=D0NQE5_PHYIT|nr:actin-like protein [Phytophthora infestans T30-4]EEY62877.1 actin-like protein [Phytophthora infestans T30-4]|eukprot:XP_002898752.1 actin-like protein [Phytophthora infestans T30-4]
MYAGGGANEGDHHSSGNAPFSSAAAEANDLDALVFEFGTSRCKFGYAGEDFPRVFERPVPHDEVHDDAELGRRLNRRSAQVERDPEKLAQWLFDASSSRLQTRLSEHPLLLVERPFTLPEETKTVQASSASKKRDLKAREQMVEVVMEELGVPALFCAKSAVLACYANARTSGLVVEMGATYTSVTSVHEGYAFAYPKSQGTLFGGHDLNSFLRTKLAPQVAKNLEHKMEATSAEIEIAKRKKQTWSYVVEAKESGLCRVADGPFDEVQNAQLPLINYELPDKTIVSLGTERFSVAEHYFLREGVSKAAESSDNSTLVNDGPGMRLPELICETGGLTTETELRKELFQNIVLTGGSSCFENMPTRIEREVVTMLSGMPLPLTGAGNNGAAGGFTNSLRVKVVAAHPQERRVGSFLGGSILASLGSFHEMWMSKAEYAEHGATLIHKKCP